QAKPQVGSAGGPVRIAIEPLLAWTAAMPRQGGGKSASSLSSRSGGNALLQDPLCVACLDPASTIGDSSRFPTRLVGECKHELGRTPGDPPGTRQARAISAARAIRALKAQRQEDSLSAVTGRPGIAMLSSIV